MPNALDISVSALIAQRERMNLIAANLANIHTTRDAAGRPNPYLRQVAVLQAVPMGPNGEAGVRLASVAVDPSVRLVHDPNHPDRDPEGNVRMPNIDALTETVDALAATRAYEANLTAIDATKSMAAAALRIIA